MHTIQRVKSQILNWAKGEWGLFDKYYLMEVDLKNEMVIELHQLPFRMLSMLEMWYSLYFVLHTFFFSANVICLSISIALHKDS